MTIRVGESWRARNGRRRWVSMPLRDALAFGAVGFALTAPFWLLWRLFLLEAWIAAESVLFLVTGILALVAVARREARLSQVTTARLRWGLYMVDLKGGR